MYQFSRFKSLSLFDGKHSTHTKYSRIGKTIISFTLLWEIFLNGGFVGGEAHVERDTESVVQVECGHSLLNLTVFLFYQNMQ